jgi:pyrroloquinoline quinone (PQQ) biosynthesis protein C
MEPLALPRFLTALHARSDDAATRAALLANAWDEEHGENNHPELWLRFADALGVSRLSVADAKLHVHHAAAERRLLEQSTASSDDSAVALWAARALDAWWAFLDGVLNASAARPALHGKKE